MAHLGRVTETMTTRTVGLTREQVAAWHDATWTDTTTPRTERPVRFFRCGSIWHRYTDGRPLSIMPATRIA